MRARHRFLRRGSDSDPLCNAFPGTCQDTGIGRNAVHLWPDEDPVTRIVKDQLDILYKQGAEAAWTRRPEGVELSLDVLWERDEMEERGTLTEYDERVKELVAKSSLKDREVWYETPLRSIDAYIDKDLSVECERVRAPTLVVHGARDHEVPVDWGRDLAAKIPGAEFRLFKDEPHSIVHGSRRVREGLMAFFRSAD